jgi:hypothetical protein
VNKPWALPSEVLKVTVILSMRASGLLNFRKVRSTNPSPSPREYDTGSNPIGITIIIRVHCVYVWNKEGGMEGEGEREREKERKREEKEKRERMNYAQNHADV